MLLRSVKRVLASYNSNIIRRTLNGSSHSPSSHKSFQASRCKYFATKPLYVVSEDAKRQNHDARIDLAIAFRALDHLGLNEGVDNHLSIMAPALSGQDNVMLVNPYGLDWSEITASSLVGVNPTGDVIEGDGTPNETAIAIHLGIRESQPTDTECIMHTHMPYATSLGALKDPTLRLIHQSCAHYLDNVAYDYNYQGLVDAREEGRNLAKCMEGKAVLMMCNHGALTTSCNVAMAFYWMFFLERCSMFQILAMSTGQELREYPERLAREINEKLGDHGWQGFADINFAATKRKMLKMYPDLLD